MKQNKAVCHDSRMNYGGNDAPFHVPVRRDDAFHEAGQVFSLWAYKKPRGTMIDYIRPQGGGPLGKTDKKINDCNCQYFKKFKH